MSAETRQAAAAIKQPGAGGGGGRAASTIVSKFNLEIEAFFLKLLTGATPKFIRCINPKPKKVRPPATMNERYNLQRAPGLV